jgi:hypothetical protein
MEAEGLAVIFVFFGLASYFRFSFFALSFFGQSLGVPISVTVQSKVSGGM